MIKINFNTKIHVTFESIEDMEKISEIVNKFNGNACYDTYNGYITVSLNHRYELISDIIKLN